LGLKCVLRNFFQKTGFEYQAFDFVGIAFNLFFIIGEADILDDRASF